MASPATCIATVAAAAAATNRPASKSLLVAAAKMNGRRALSIGGGCGGALTTSASCVRESSNPSSSSSSLGDSQSRAFPGVDIRREYSSISSSRRFSIHDSGNSTHTTIVTSNYAQNTMTTATTTTTTTTTRINQLATRSFSSASKRDFYEVLGIGKGADKAEIKKSYFKLAKQYHPDTNQVSE